MVPITVEELWAKSGFIRYLRFAATIEFLRRTDFKGTSLQELQGPATPKQEDLATVRCQSEPLLVAPALHSWLQNRDHSRFLQQHRRGAIHHDR